MKWIGRGTLRVSDKLILKYGDEIPDGVLTKERVKTFKKLGKVGEIVERINEHPEVRALKAQIARRDEKIEKLKGEIKEFEAQYADLEDKKDGTTGVKE